MKQIKVDKSSKNNYPGGNLMVVKKEKLSKDKNLEQYFNFYEMNCDMLRKMNDTKNYKLYTIFRTLDTKESKHKAQVPHFDKQPTLKFMLYVNDININQMMIHGFYAVAYDGQSKEEIEEEAMADGIECSTQSIRALHRPSRCVLLDGRRCHAPHGKEGHYM